MTSRKWTRRDILKGISIASAGLAGSVLMRPRRRAHAQAMGEQPRFLIVLCATGGASIIDSVLAIRASESASASTINCFPDALVQDIEGSPFRAVDQQGGAIGPLPFPFTANQSDFVRKHHQRMLAATWTRTSVNHAVGQRRSVTGNEAWQGRTLQELVAMTHGPGHTLPNVHLVTGTGYTERGSDDSLPTYCYGEPVPNPVLWPLALDGMRGTAHPVDRDLLARARALRNDTLESLSPFTKAMGNSGRVRHWKDLRNDRQQAIEDADLITKMMVVPDAPPQVPLSEHGLASSPAGQLVRDKLPNYLSDPLEAQAALAFLLIKYRVSVTVTLGPSFDAVLNGARLANPPIAFDFSHQSHRASQAFMWNRILHVADALIDLLAAEELEDGVSLWDRTMIYVASDFGRSKNRPANAEDFGSGHDLNNGVLLISPLVRGNTVLGGVDKNTGLTYGFDPRTGAPEPGRTMTEAEIYAGIVQALGIDTSGSGLPSVPAMQRA